MFKFVRFLKIHIVHDLHVCKLGKYVYFVVIERGLCCFWFFYQLKIFSTYKNQHSIELQDLFFFKLLTLRIQIFKQE